MTDGSANIRQGRERGSFHALRLARRNRLRQGKVRATWRSHQAEVRERPTRILVLVTMALGFELSGAALTLPLLGINRVAIRGTERLPADEAAATRSAAALPAGTNLLLAPTGKMELRLRNLPWVRTARVDRVSPHALGIRLFPRDPVVVAQFNGQRFEIDATGVPIRRMRPAEDQRLPRVEFEKAANVRPGVPMQDESLLAAIKIYHDAPSQPMAHIAEIKVDPTGNMCLNMKDGMQVQLGQPEDLAEKIKYVQRVYQADPNVCSRMSAINLSVPKQPACTLKTDIPADPAGVLNPASQPDVHKPERDVAL